MARKADRFKIDLPTQLTLVMGGLAYTMYLQSGQEPEQRERPCLVYKLSRPYRDELEKQSKSLGSHLERPDHNMRVIIPVKANERVNLRIAALAIVELNRADQGAGSSAEAFRGLCRLHGATLGPNRW